MKKKQNKTEYFEEKTKFYSKAIVALRSSNVLKDNITLGFISTARITSNILLSYSSLFCEFNSDWTPAFSF